MNWILFWMAAVTFPLVCIALVTLLQVVMMEMETRKRVDELENKKK